MSPALGLSILLGLSVAGNLWLFHSRDVLIATSATAEQVARDTKAAADACTTSVSNLEAAGKRRHDNMMSKLAAQAGEVAELKGAAIGAQNAKPADPADLCKSLEIYLRREIRKERGK